MCRRASILLHRIDRYIELYHESTVAVISEQRERQGVAVNLEWCSQRLSHRAEKPTAGSTARHTHND